MLKQSLRLLAALSFTLFTSLVWAAKAVNYTPPNFIPDQVVSDDKIIYLLSKSNKSIYRWSIATSAYLSPLTVGLVKDAVEYTPTIIEIAPGHSRLYVGYETGDIRYIRLTGSTIETNFAKTAMPIKQLVAAGKFLIGIDGTSDYVGNRYSFNNRGTKVDQDTNHLGYRHSWSPTDSKIYLSNGNSVATSSIDQKTGKLDWRGWTDFWSANYHHNNPLLSISADGQYLLTSDGKIKHTRAQIVDVDLDRYFRGGKFLSDSSVVALAQKNYLLEPALVLEIRDPKLRLVEQRDYTGSFFGIYGAASKLALVLVNNNKVSIETYIPSQDSDSDGVKNSADAFPLDAAASRDTDKDGYPDAWNKNQNASSSPTGLVLDAYPKDAECFNQGQGNGKVCDYSQIVPNYFVPDQTLSDGKIVYLLSQQHKKIYRWSLDTATYLSPLKVGLDAGYSTLFPTAMAFSAEYKRIYFGYSTGAVTYIQTTGTATERSFAVIPNAVTELEAVGKYVLVYDKYRDAKYTFDLKGVQRDKNEQWRGGGVHKSVWDSVLARLYFVQTHDVEIFHYMVVNQTSGKITELKSSSIGRPYQGRSISVSVDGSQLLVGNGDIYKSKDLTLIGSLGQSVDAAKWLADGSVVRARTANDRITVEWFGKDFQRIDEQNYAGSSVIGLFGTDKKMQLLVQNNGRLTGYIYEPKNDSDGDKVPNLQDAFPNDPAASVDGDNDGYPDSWNKGYNQSSSTTGLVLDAYPKDSACYLPAHGDGTHCDYTAAMPDFIPDQIASDGKVIYYLSKANNRIYRWSITDKKFINPWVVGINQTSTRIAPRKMALSQNHGRMYLGYETGHIRYINLNGVKENDFSVVATSVNGLAAVGNYLLAQDDSGAWVTHYIFNAAGVLTDNKDWNYYSSEYAWDSTRSRVYFFRDDTSPNDLHFEVVDQNSGKITQKGETPYHGSYYIFGVIRVSNDGTRVLLGSGDIYNSTDLTWATSVGAITDARWLADNSLVTVKNTGSHFVVERRDANLKLVEKKIFAGEVLGIFGADTKMTLAAFVDGKISAYSYSPSDDSDDDGVENTVDAFPLDPAASVDTDNDGYPDFWNPGKSASDSTSGLTLDAYSQDSACYLPEHGDGSECDYAATMPDFIPDQIASDGDVIYYLSTVNNKIYRWSIADKKFINPWIVGVTQGLTRITPVKMALSQNHSRMYLGYETGQIRYIDLHGVKENAFAAVAMSVNGLAAVGDYLLVQDNSGAWATHYVFNSAGVLTDSKDWNYYSPEYTWDSVNSKIYFFSSFSPADLNFEVIDQNNGKITQEGETPYHGAYNISGVIRVSNDGSHVLLGSGDIYNGTGLTWATSVGTIIDARWLADSSLVTVKNTGSDFVVERRNAKMQIVEHRVFAGEVLGIYGSDTKMTLAAFINGELGAYTYVPSNDSDNDGVENTVDAFPLDSAASVDTDNDGYPDAWNPGYTQTDSTTNLTLDAYPQDSACYLSAHGNGIDCDYGATIPNYVPDQIASDANYIYLLSSANQRIYRWSLADRKYVNPLIVGYKQGLTTLVPTKMALSEAHQRIYLSYGSGAIRSLNLQTGQELAFANTAKAVNGLASVGNYLLAQDDSGAWATHYIFDENGTITDSKDWNHYSAQYTWSPLDSRVYYNGYREMIDQDSGKITEQSSVPYSYGSDLMGARVSLDGSLILLSDGAIYSSSDSTLQNTLSTLLGDALWADKALVTLENNQLKLRNLADYSVLQSFPVSGTALRIVADGQNVVVVHSVNGAVQFNQFAIGDNDGDGLPKWWEDANGLDDDYAGDVVLDSDGDTLTNLEEYQAKTNPNTIDTDGDGISDGNEVKTYLTNPLKVDTDADGLNDYVELFDHQTDPLKADTDGDSFTDYLEVIVYNTDPKSVSSIPPFITVMQESFEAANLSPLWVAGTDSKANWTVDTISAFVGTNSIRSGAIGHNEKSSIVYKGLFAAGTLSFYARVEAEGCCDQLHLYVDGEWKFSVSSYSGSWTQYLVPLTSGNHEIEWRYQKDGSVAAGADAAWIDKVEFIAN